MKRTKILHIITGLNTGGAELALSRLMESADQEKFDMQVVSMISIGTVGENLINLGFNVTSLDMPPGRPTLTGIRKIITLTKQFQPDIIQTWLYHADLLGLLVAKLCGVPILMWNIRIAELDFSQYRKLSGLVMKICAMLSSIPQSVIVNSRAGQIVHARLGYRPKQWIYIPNGININTFSPDPAARKKIRSEWQIPPDDILIGHVGRFTPQKDHKNFLNAIAIVQKSHPNTHFVCVGDGSQSYLEELKTLANNLNINNIIWAGLRHDMPAIYNAFDVLVLSSNGEGFPNVVAEAMACEKPCVVTNVGDACYLIGNSGLCVEPGNSSELAQAIIRLLKLSTIERDHLGKIARSRISDYFSFDKMINAYASMYEKFASITKNTTHDEIQST